MWKGALGQTEGEGGFLMEFHELHQVGGHILTSRTETVSTAGTRHLLSGKCGAGTGT